MVRSSVTMKNNDIKRSYSYLAIKTTSFISASLCTQPFLTFQWGQFHGNQTIICNQVRNMCTPLLYTYADSRFLFSILRFWPYFTKTVESMLLHYRSNVIIGYFSTYDLRFNFFFRIRNIVVASPSENVSRR